jgi:hypothetical protein
MLNNIGIWAVGTFLASCNQSSGGQYRPSPMVSYCIDCSAGRYSTDPIRPYDCLLPCGNAGEYCAAGSSAPQQCPANHYCEEDLIAGTIAVACNGTSAAGSSSSHDCVCANGSYGSDNICAGTYTSISLCLLFIR